METKYGKISDITAELCLDGYIDKIFKILPMKEEKCPTLTVYVQALIREFIGMKSLMEGLLYEKELLSLIATLENLSLDEIPFDEFRSDVFKSISIVKKMKENLGDKNGFV